MGKNLDNMEGCGRIVKWSMFITNFIIFIGGVTVLGVGIWTMVDKSFIEELLRNQLYMSAAYVLLVSGVIITFLSFFGCFGAIKKVKCLLLTYFTLVFCIFVILLIAGCLGYVFREQVHANMKAEMLQDVREYDPSKPNSRVTEAWDLTQSQLKCCGIYTEQVNKPYEIWRYNEKLNSGKADDVVPSSCCKVRDDGTAEQCVVNNKVVAELVWEKDCYVEGYAFVSDHAEILGGAAITVAFVMVLGMVFSIILFKLIE